MQREKWHIFLPQKFASLFLNRGKKHASHFRSKYIGFDCWSLDYDKVSSFFFFFFTPLLYCWLQNSDHRNRKPLTYKLFRNWAIRWMCYVTQHNWGRSDLTFFITTMWTALISLWCCCCCCFVALNWKDLPSAFPLVALGRIQLCCFQLKAHRIFSL